MSLPRVAITFGDPAGIGPEVILKSFHKYDIMKFCKPVILGSFSIAREQGFDFSGIPCEKRDIPLRRGMITAGRPSSASGEASFRYLLEAVDMASSGKVDAVVTAPIAKMAWKAAGHNYSGHTELLGELTKTKKFAMLMAAKKARVVMVTRHLPLREVSGNLSSAAIYDTAVLAKDFLVRMAGIRKPRICVLALNPHAGEAGMLGTEEARIIFPAVRKLARKGIKVSGPLPSDSAWLKHKNGMFDLLIAMYHDQAMTGVKLLAPESIVNATLGLPFMRTSPGHGTAFDIAGKKVADPGPMAEAIIFAAKYCGKQHYPSGRAMNAY